MKKSFILALLMCFSLCGVAQDAKKKSNNLLKELSQNACKCIDSINTSEKSNEDVAKEINKCIDAQTGAYQLGSKLMGIDLSGAAENKDKKSIDININTNKNSTEYKSYYFEIERYLMDNCKALKTKLAAHDITSDKSLSNNEKAMELYSKGIKFFKKDDYKSALPFFEKAVKADSLFAFAWDNLGVCQRKLDNYDGAIYAYEKSLSLDPNGIMPLQNIAVAYQYKKEYTKAIKAYETLAQLDSFNPEVFYGIGQIYAFYLNDQEKALDNICKAYKLYVKQKSPYRTDAEKIIGTIYQEMKKQDKLTRFNEILKENDINVN